MPPGKKTKKTKRKSKDPTSKRRAAGGGGAQQPNVPAEAKGLDTEWWYSFLQKSADSGAKFPKDEDEAFKHFFRMPMRTFEYVCSLVREDLVSRPPSGLINIEGRLLSVEKQVAIALRRLASGDSQVSVGAAFGVGQSTVSQVTWRFIESMEERSKHHLQWPNSEKMEDIKAKFETEFGLPNCCGVIDATHISMTLPVVESSEDWCDPQKNYSMFLQGIVDHETRFIDIVTGWPGGMTVPRLLKCSGFYKLCEAGERLNGAVKVSAKSEEVREFIIGDSRYPLLPWLVTPYEGKCTAAPVVAFNERHEAIRQVGEKAMSLLKGTWRILNKVMWRPDKHKLPSIILVCCILQNIIIDCGNEVSADAVARSRTNNVSSREQGHHQSQDPNGKGLRDILSRHIS